jgi:hypothetical protein
MAKMKNVQKYCIKKFGQQQLRAQAHKLSESITVHERESNTKAESIWGCVFEIVVV